MLAYSVIEKKQAGKELNKDELKFFIIGFLNKEIPTYQMSALLMAIYFKGMTEKETTNLLDIIINSGKKIKFKKSDKFIVDKHSTGGVGDKISIILAPLLAATGKVKIPMISGRALGHSGGTLDKLESIPGFTTNMSIEQFKRQTNKIGCALIGQTDDICPADRELYALRDVTATVRSIPMICGSILSKKIAEGIEGLVLDVKTGNGAFIQEYSRSLELAKKLKYFGENYGLKVRAVITDMDQPLGNKIGNWLEIEESLDVLKGNGPTDVKEVTLELAQESLMIENPTRNVNEIKKELNYLIDSGVAFEKLKEIAKYQGGNTSFLDNPQKYKKAKYIKDVIAKKTGYLHKVNSMQLGLDAIDLGAGRRTSEDKIDPVSGIEIHKKIGDKIEKNDLIFKIHSNDKDAVKNIEKKIESRLELSEEIITKKKLIIEKI